MAAWVGAKPNTRILRRPTGYEMADRSVSPSDLSFGLVDDEFDVPMAWNLQRATDVAPRWPIFSIGYFLLFLSGAAALVYEISWSRQIGLLFGRTAQSASVVLFSYFVGTAVGCLWGSRWARRLPPLVAYAVAELAAAVWACVIPALLRLSESTAIAAWLNSSSWILQTSIRGVFCFSLLMPATIALGVTLPMMAEFFSSPSWRDSNAVGMNRVSLAYALNTAGAIFGVTAATFFLLPIVGVRASSYVAAGLSATCGFLAGIFFLLDCHKRIIANTTGKLPATRVSMPRFNPPPETIVEPTAQATVRPQHQDRPMWFAVATLSGFGTMSLEILYIRLFSLVFHNSTYTFGAVVAVFLASLALGAAIAARLQQANRTAGLAGRSACLGAVATLFSLQIFSQVTGLNYFSFGNSFAIYMVGVFLLVGLVVGPPVTCLGLLLPLAWKGTGSEVSAGSTVGRLTAGNAICSALGVAVTSFVILPHIGLCQCFALLATTFLLASFVLLWRDGQRQLAASGVVLFAVLAVCAVTWPLETVDARAGADERLVRRWQSPYGLIDVMQNRNTGSLKVRQNLHYRFGETRTAGRESRQAHIPLLLHERPRDVFVMGLGTGLSAGGAIAHEDVESILVVELIPEVIEAARLLAKHNHGVVDHPKVKIRIDDARHFLLACDRHFDVIVSDLFVPWESETGYLYTVEHYRVARQRLKSGGLFCQWIPLYQLGEREFELIANSFASVFPTATVWWGNINPAQPIIAIIGSQSSIEIDTERLTARLASLENATKSHDEYLSSSQMFHTMFLGDWVLDTSNDLNTDEYPRVEFLAPVSHRDERLLSGSTLHEYFNKVLARLPSRSARFNYRLVKRPPRRVNGAHRSDSFCLLNKVPSA